MLLRGGPDEVWGAPHDGRRSGDVARFDSWQRTILKFSSRRSISYAVRKSYRRLVGAENTDCSRRSISYAVRKSYRGLVGAENTDCSRRSISYAAHPAKHVWKVHVVFFALFLFATRGRHVRMEQDRVLVP